MKIVIVNGWSAPNALWHSFVTELKAKLAMPIADVKLIELNKALSVEQWCEHIATELDANTVLIGWSLGAMLAAQTLISRECKVKGFISLMANPSFVANETCTWAVPKAQFQDFYQQLTKDHEAALRAFKALLVAGEPSARKALKPLSSAYVESQISPAVLRQSLELLGRLQVEDCYNKLAVPSLFVWAEHDALSACPNNNDIASLRQNFAHHRFECTEACSHLPMFSASNKVQSLIVGYLNNQRCAPLGGVHD